MNRRVIASPLIGPHTIDWPEAPHIIRGAPDDPKTFNADGGMNGALSSPIDA